MIPVTQPVLAVPAQQAVHVPEIGVEVGGHERAFPLADAAPSGGAFLIVGTTAAAEEVDHPAIRLWTIGFGCTGPGRVDVHLRKAAGYPANWDTRWHP